MTLPGKIVLGSGIPARVLFNARMYGAGGRETHLIHLAELLIAQGAEVVLVTRFCAVAAPDVELRRLGVRVVTTPFRCHLRLFRLSTLWALFFWRWQLRRGYFDTIYSLEVSPFLSWLQRFRKPNGVTIWNPVGPLPKHPQLLPAKIRPAVDLMIVETEWHRAAAKSCFGFDGAVTTAPHLCVDIRSPVRARVVADGELRVGYLGRLDSAKGIFRLLDIWPTLQIGKASLSYFGEGPERSRLVAAIHERGLEGSVDVQQRRWVGEAQLREIAESIDLAVLPSEGEGLPLVLIELLGLGIPFVASDVGAIPLLAVDNPDVRVVPLNHEAFRIAISEMSSRIRSGKLNHGRLRRLYEVSFSRTVLASQWRKVFESPKSVRVASNHK